MTLPEALRSAAPSPTPVTVAPARPVSAARPRAPFDGAQVARTAMIILGVLAVFGAFYVRIGSGLEEGRTQRLMYLDLRQDFAEQTAPVGGSIRSGVPVGLVAIPRIGLHTSVFVEGTSSDDLSDGPGHKRNTPLPGQPGTSVLFGRSLSFGHPFAHLGRLAQGDTISVTTQQGTFSYLVDGVRHKGDPVPVLTGAAHLLLVSADGSGLSGSWAPDREVFVDATLRGAPASGAVAGTSVALDSDELAMQGDTSGLAELVLLLQVLLLVLGVIAWAALLWSARNSWILGAPVVLACLWVIAHQSLLLVPNLL